MITINNKFSVGQKVAYLDSKRQAHKATVERISSSIYKGKTYIYYELSDTPFTLFVEEELYASLEDLRKAIFGNLIEFV
jgi:hypothetical protein